MTENSLFPASVQISYQTDNAPHLMTIPLTDWSPPSSGHLAGTNLAWNASQVDTDDMISALVNSLLPLFGAGVSFNSYIINTYADEVSPARPQVVVPMSGFVGSGATGIPAAQTTFNFKTSGFGAFKLVLLEARVTTTFNPLNTLTSPTHDDWIAVRDVILDDANAFSGRDNDQPTLLKRITFTLNEKLRASYRLN